MNAYATNAEFANHPTGLDITDLVAGGDAAAQTAELTLLIQQASSMADRWVYQPLYAHAGSLLRHQTSGPYGVCDVRCPDFPLQTVSLVQWRQSPVEPWQVVPTTQMDLYSTLNEGHKVVLYGVFGQGRPITVQMQYVAGYPNMALTAVSGAGATTLTVDTTLGVAEGQSLNLYDGASYETVTVSSTTATTLTLSAPTQFAHGIGVRVSAVPDAITLATIYATAWLIKERRAGGGLMMSGKVQPTNLQTSEDMQLFRQLLQPFRRVV